MKVRSRPKRRLQGSNPLLIDPSRTSTLSRGFSEQLIKRLSIFEKELIKLLITDDAFGLTTNTFCPTGKGGGVDPTCGTDKKKPDYKALAAEVRGMSDTEFDKILARGVPPKPKKDLTVKVVKAKVYDVDNLPVYTGGSGKEGKHVTYHTTSKAMAESYVSMYNERFGSGGKLNAKNITIQKAAPWDVIKRLAERLGMSHDDYTPASIFDNNLFDDADVGRLIAGLKKEGYDGAVLDDIGYGVQIQGKAYITFTGALTTNVFCPTGKGGGVDPSCSPGGKKHPASDKSKPLKTRLESLKKDFISIAQKEYDAWDASGEFGDEVVGGGGICSLISQEFGSKLAEHGIDSIEGGSDGDDHSWLIAYTDKEAFGVDIPPNVYETGGGYSWEKIPDVTFEEGDVEIWKMNRKDLSDLVDNTSSWQFETSQQKIDNFEKWIISKLTETLEDQDDYRGIDWWKTWIERAYKQGASRTYDEIKRKGGTIKQAAGMKEGFLSSALNDPSIVDKYKVLIGRTHKSLKGLSENIKQQLTLELTEGLVQGLSPRQIARNLVSRLGITKVRAKAIARTEIVRANAQGQLASMKALGVKNLGVNVEFSASKKACPKCKSLDGKVYTLEQAEGLLPVHVNCRCAFTPHVEPSPSPQRKRNQASIEASILRSQKAHSTK